MKYHKLDREVIDKILNKGISNANGEYVPNAKAYFDKIGKREILLNTPIFDYFHLQSYVLKMNGNGNYKIYMAVLVFIQEEVIGIFLMILNCF